MDFDVIGNLDDIRAKQNFLSRLLETVQVEVKAGKNQEEIMKLQTIKGAEEWSGNGIGRCISATYQEITSE